jgi:hypothetical protein
VNGFAVVLIVVAAICFAIIVTANAISRQMVRWCARRLPLPLSLRMEEEWLAELHAIQNRPGMLAFGVALLLTRRKAFVGPQEDFGAIAIHERRGSFLGSWKSLLVLSTLLCAAVAFGLSYLLPVEYASEATILFGKPDIPESVAHNFFGDLSTDDRMKRFSTVVLSRPALINIAREFQSELRQFSLSMDERVSRLRRKIEITRIDTDSSLDEFKIRFTGTDPVSVQRVTSRLTDLVLKMDSEIRTARVNGTVEFLSTELDKISEELVASGKQTNRASDTDAIGEPKRLAHEMLVAQYKTIYTKLQDAQLSLSMETKQRGAQIKVIDPPQLGHRVGPNRYAISGIGALIGLAMGGTAIAGIRRRHRRVLA